MLLFLKRVLPWTQITAETLITVMHKLPIRLSINIPFLTADAAIKYSPANHLGLAAQAQIVLSCRPVRRTEEHVLC